MNIKWKADDYTKEFQFVHQYGQDVLDLVEIKPGERILDLGCGNGALTKKISDLGADAIGIDASEDMLKIAKSAYPELHFEVGDATRFMLKQPADAVFSNAVFHWIDDQDQLLNSIAGALKPSGRLVCEFGGKGCAETIHFALQQAFESRSLKYRRTFYFPTIGEYAPRLENHGLRVVYATLFDRMTELVGNKGMENWIKMFVTQPFEGLSDSVTEAIIADAVNQLAPALYRNGVWCADYVRIRFKAIKIN